MSDPFRLRVQKALVVALEQIKQRDPKTGDQLPEDFSGCVFRGRDGFGENDPLPMISILEPPLPIDQILPSATNPRSNGQWDLMIQGFVEDDKANPTDPAHWLLADVKKVLADEKARKLPNSAGTPNPFCLGMPAVVGGKNIGNCVSEIAMIGPGVVRPPEIGVSNKAFFWLTLTLKIAEDISNPFV